MRAASVSICDNVDICEVSQNSKMWNGSEDFLMRPDEHHLTTNRIRQVGHTEGQFTTLIYIPPSKDFSEVRNRHSDTIYRVLDSISGGHHPGPPASVWTIIGDDEEHMSLSRTLFVKSHIKDSLLSQLRDSRIRDSDTCLYLRNTLRVYLNEERNTAFLGFPVDPTVSPYALEMIRRIDTILEIFGLPVFYDNPDPHISIAYTTDKETVNRLHKRSGEDVGCVELSDAELDRFRIDVGQIHIRIGNQIHLV